jgi:hypothetical protein
MRVPERVARDQTPLANAINQLTGRNFESAGNCYDVQQCDVTFASLNSANVIPVEPSFFRKLFLRPVPGPSQVTDRFTEESSWISRHSPIVSVTTLLFYTL